MTRELMETCAAAMDDAIKSGDAMAIARAQARAMKALMECQLRTSERLKRFSRIAYGLFAAAAALVSAGVPDGGIIRALVRVFGGG